MTALESEAARLNGGRGDADGLIGVDVGGTHTDALVIIDGRVERGKALTTHGDYSRGVLNAVEVAATRCGLEVGDLLARARLFVNGTTVVTNAITELRGASVGVLVTAGFRDTFRFAGGPRLAEFDDHLQLNVPDLVQREAIVEIEERIDYAGNVLVPIDLDQVRTEARRLVDDVHVDALAVCFISSFVNGEHETAAADAIRELYPDLFITLSHRVFPISGENRRWTTAVMNSFVYEGAATYLDSLEKQLREAGLTGGLAFFQGLGGGISPEKAREYPLTLLGSGPAGGAIGANELARRMNHKRVLLGDMGGTSFDTGIINDNAIHIDKNVALGAFSTGVNIVDVVSIGAGGGSIAWVSERGVPQVGPHSAGSSPGPAALDQGGCEPTVTDAMVALGFVDPDRYLGGRIKLKLNLARKALEERFGARFGWSAEEAAAAIHDLVVVNMANAVREVSVEKGYDPRDFLFLAYGGMLPLFGPQIAERLGINTIVVPQNSSVFCAMGLLASDFVLRYDQGVGWDLGKPAEVERLNTIANRILETGRREMLAEGFADDKIEVVRSADFRFQGQAYELTMPIPARELTPDDAAALSQAFLELYERTYGVGTAWKGVPTTLVNFSATVIGRRDRPALQPAGRGPAQPAAPPFDTRRVFLPAERRHDEIPVYDGAGFAAFARVEGPAIVDEGDTTIYVPAGVVAERDEYLNYVLTRGEGV